MLSAFLTTVFLLITPPFFSLHAQNNNSKERLIVRYKQQAGLSDKLKIRKLIGSVLSDSIDKLNIQVLEVPSAASDKALEVLLKNNLILYAEKDALAYASEMTNDTYLGNQWGLTKIQAAGSGESAWNYAKGNSSVLVSVIDTGIDQNHPDLIGKIAKNKNCTSSTTVDDKYAHGTHVAGIAAAVTNNGSGVAGLGYNVRLINAKGLGDNGSGYYSWIANCIIWSADNGAQVLNLSLGGSASSQALSDAVNYAVNKGAVLVAAAGNSNSSSPSYPAYFTNAIAVAATDSNDQKASFSNYGNWVDLAAPGVSIYSTAPNHTNQLKIYNYAYLSGTSMATPFVAALAALIKSAGNLTGQEIKDNLYSNADKISGTGSLWAHGRINALNSIKEVSVFTPSLTLTPTPTLTPPAGDSPTPTITPTPTPTVTPTRTPTRTPTPAIPSGASPTPTPWYCRYWPQYCQ